MLARDVATLQGTIKQIFLVFYLLTTNKNEEHTQMEGIKSKVVFCTASKIIEEIIMISLYSYKSHYISYIIKPVIRGR